MTPQISTAVRAAWWRQGWSRLWTENRKTGPYAPVRTIRSESRFEKERPNCEKCNAPMMWFWANDFTGWLCMSRVCRSRIGVVKTRCGRCLKTMVCEWPEPCSFGGKETTAKGYAAAALQSDSVLIVCDDCLPKMRGVDLSELHFE